jgi:hypothetical protein
MISPLRYDKPELNTAIIRSWKTVQQQQAQRRISTTHTRYPRPSVDSCMTLRPVASATISGHSSGHSIAGPIDHVDRRRDVNLIDHRRLCLRLSVTIVPSQWVEWLRSISQPELYVPAIGDHQLGRFGFDSDNFSRECEYLR